MRVYISTILTHSKTKNDNRICIQENYVTIRIPVTRLCRRIHGKHAHHPSHNVEKSFAVRTTARVILFFYKRKIYFLIP